MEQINKLPAILTVALLVMTINCSTATNGNQINALSQNASEPGTISSGSRNGISESPTAAPDAIVKDLYKLHDADKSPIYKAKNRAEMEKFFSRDFVNLVWTGGSEPNLMNRLASEGDVLTGLDASSKSEGQSIGKADLKGDKKKFRSANLEILLTVISKTTWAENILIESKEIIFTN